jgi:hypothetical protein
MSENQELSVRADDLAAFVSAETESVNPYKQEDIENLYGGSDFFPVLKLMTSSADAVKNGSVPPNTFILQAGKQMQMLGKSVDVLVFAVRPLALHYSNDNEVIAKSYDTQSATYQTIAARVASGVNAKGFLEGPEFLVWIPDLKCMATYVMGSRSAKNASGPMRALLINAENGVNPAHLTSEMIKSKKNGMTYSNPVVTKAATPITTFPTVDVVKSMIGKFFDAESLKGKDYPEAAPEAARER